MQPDATEPPTIRAGTAGRMGPRGLNENTTDSNK